MKISGLDTKQYITGVDPTGETSYLIVNCLAEVYNEETAITETKPLTYKVSLDELGKMLITSKQLVTYNNLDGESNPVKQLKTIGTENSAYSVQYVGQYISDDDRITLNNVQTDYTDTDYPETSPETINWNKYYVKAVTNTNGTIATEHAQFAPSITWTDAVAGTNNAKPTIGISVGGNNSTTVTPNVATTDLYGITKLSNTAGADETVAATPTGVQNAINNLTGNLNSTSPAASKTLTAFSQTNGIVSATFGDIAIANTQVGGLGTASTASTASSIAAGSTSTDLPTSAAVASFVEGKNYLTSFTETDPTVPSWAKESTKPTYAITELTGIPALPTTNGTYTLQVVINNNTPTYSWVSAT